MLSSENGIVLCVTGANENLRTLLVSAVDKNEKLFDQFLWYLKL